MANTNSSQQPTNPSQSLLPALANGPRKRNESLASPDFPTQTPKALAAYRAEKYGRPVNNTCPGCGGLGFVRCGREAEDPEFGKAQKCPICSEGQRRQWLQTNCGLNDSELLHRLDDWQPGTFADKPECRQQRIKALQVMRGMLERRTGLFTFHGDFGGGKSFALQVMVNEFRERLIESYYVTFAGVLDHLRSLYSQRQETSTYWQRLLDVPVLAIDEATRFDDKGWAQEKLFLLVDTRYRRRKSHLTLFGTNDDPGQMLPPGDNIGYVFSRMREGVILELRGDMRQVMAEFEF